MSEDPFSTDPGSPRDLPAPIRADILECRLRLEAEDTLSLSLWPDAGEGADGAAGSTPIRGAMALHPGLDQEVEAAGNPTSAGSRLFDAILPEGEPTLQAYREASRRARQERRRLCLSLTFDAGLPPWVDDLPWELLFDPRWRLALGRSHSAAVERRLDPPAHAPFAPLPSIEGELRLLMAVASPDDQSLHNFPQLDRTWEEWTLGSALRRLEGLVDWHVLDGPASAERVRRELSERAYHALHLVVHGQRRPGQERARLLLEDAEGHGTWADHRQLAA
ncbi:MAG: CHAT domain-containing protein, partial [Holophagales bacterium]|nr:CHAT domain-containing protein [Holophagales bacterium]